MPINAEDILSFWIGNADENADEIKTRNKFWYSSAPETDEMLREKFGAALELAEQGKLDSWQQQPREALALVILLDQFSRNLYRGTAQAFANDDKVLSVAKAVISRGDDQALGPIGRAFLYHPFEHAELLSEQDESVRLFSSLAAEASEDFRQHLENFADYADQHRDVIAQFGRFPHRNAALGRTNTEEEQAYLDDGARRYGQ